jgi:hypothetical protein
VCTGFWWGNKWLSSINNPSSNFSRKRGYMSRLLRYKMNVTLSKNMTLSVDRFVVKGLTYES